MRQPSVSHFNNELAVPLVMQVNGDGFLWIVNIPEDSLAVLIEGSSRDESGHVGSGHPDAVIPRACGLRVSPDTRNVDERDFEAAPKSPELLSAPDSNVSLPFAIDRSTNESHL
jgi:hypothetical protein